LKGIGRMGKSQKNITRREKCQTLDKYFDDYEEIIKARKLKRKSDILNSNDLIMEENDAEFVKKYVDILYREMEGEEWSNSSRYREYGSVLNEEKENKIIKHLAKFNELKEIILKRLNGMEMIEQNKKESTVTKNDNGKT
jgi:hypothetical protein